MNKNFSLSDSLSGLLHSSWTAARRTEIYYGPPGPLLPHASTGAVVTALALCEAFLPYDIFLKTVSRSFPCKFLLLENTGTGTALPYSERTVQYGHSKSRVRSFSNSKGHPTICCLKLREKCECSKPSMTGQSVDLGFTVLSRLFLQGNFDLFVEKSRA